MYIIDQTAWVQSTYNLRMSPIRRYAVPGSLLILLLAACSTTQPMDAQSDRQWLAGDHHIHSRYSVGWDRTQEPPLPVVGGDGIYPIPMNALMARHFGLRWMAATDHGGPNHSKVNFRKAYPEMVLSREVVPEVVQFYALELNSPGADHSSVIMPHGPHEARELRAIESRYDHRETWPPDPARNQEPLMLEALAHMQAMTLPPVVIAHHPSRSSESAGAYGLYRPDELRAWNDAAPNVAVGMEGAPGHQAAAIKTDGSAGRRSARGGYSAYPTMGGFDQMTARLGGFWDSMLAEGRRWWITANSDSHAHWREGGMDFWPGEYSKTYVYARHDATDILDGLRNGRVFVTTGDLVTELYVEAGNANQRAGIGGVLTIKAGDPVDLSIRLLDPVQPNSRGEMPELQRVDLIIGSITGPAADPTADRHDQVRVVRSFSSGQWRHEGDYLVMDHRLPALDEPAYVRVRGTNTRQAEPLADEVGEDPWQDLWFYSNPVFIELR